MTSVSNVHSGPAAYHSGEASAAPPAASILTPTQAIVAEANRVAYVTDDLGRRLGFTRISASLRRRVLKAMTPEAGDKTQLFVMAVTAASCVEIDGQRVPFPTTEAQLDALIDRLEHEGLTAIAEGWAEHFPVERKLDLKNS